MNIKPVHKTTFRAKQIAPKFLIDIAQNPANVVTHRLRLLRNFDYNVQGARADIDDLFRL